MNVYAPTSGVIVAQNITNAAAAGVNLSGSATAFTIADLSNVWILCDVYENDLPKVHLGQEAQIKLTAYPGSHADRARERYRTGARSNDSHRKSTHRVGEPRNPELGMFVTATLMSRSVVEHAAVPAIAILHLHDREWVFVPAGGKQFKRVEVTGGDMLPGGQQEILRGIAPGQQVVKDVLNLEATVEAQ